MSSTLNKCNTENYRNDIQGLRGLACLAVVFYHYFPNTAIGGFTGVDIFFVISGFVISKNIIRDIYDNKFSIISFYARRIRRIFPALITVLFLCFLIGLCLLTPIELINLGKSMIGGSLEMENIFLITEINYFDISSNLKPLVHLWSLGIEEQFYLVYPCLLLFSYKFFKKLLKPLIILIIISLLLSIIITSFAPSYAFYSPFTRFWELFIGGALACLVYKKDNKLTKILSATRLLKEIVSCLGFVLVITSFMFITSLHNFPGIIATLPVIGATLIILAGENTYLNKNILSNKIMFWFGFISYPLYLWHWPLFSYTYIVTGRIPTTFVPFVLIILSILLAYITARFIEPPLRYGKATKRNTILLICAILLMALLGFICMKTKGLPSRVKQYQDNSLNEIAKNKIELYEKNCEKIFPQWSKTNDLHCALQNEKGKNKIAIIGDSHSLPIFNALLLSPNITSGIEIFPASCAIPLIDIQTGMKELEFKQMRESGVNLHNKAFKNIEEDNEVDIVILTNNISCSLNSIKDLRNPQDTDIETIWRNGLIRTLDFLKTANKKVLILLDNPTIPFSQTSCDLRPLRIFNNKCSFDKNIDFSKGYKNKYNKIVKEISRNYDNVNILDISSLLCDDKSCYIGKDFSNFYRDQEHLNIEGSLYIAPYLANAVKTLENKK